MVRRLEMTGEEIAGMLGISSATLSQHLRSARRNLLESVFDDSTRGGADR